MAFILMLLTAFVYRDADAGWSSAARVAVWSFFVLMGTFALHRMVIREEMRNDRHQDQSAEVFGSSDIRSLMRQDIVPVIVGRDHADGSGRPNPTLSPALSIAPEERPYEYTINRGIGQ